MVDAENYLILYLYEKKTTFGLYIIWFHANCLFFINKYQRSNVGKRPLLGFSSFGHMEIILFHI